MPAVAGRRAGLRSAHAEARGHADPGPRRRAADAGRADEGGGRPERPVRGATGGKLKATAVIAPPYATTQELDPFDQNEVLAKAVAAAAAPRRAVGRDAGLHRRSASAAAATAGRRWARCCSGQHWKLPSFWAHEIGHWLGLSHGRSPGCPTPGSVVGCDERVELANEYGDFFDIMGSGADRFGAFQLRVLGLQTPPDAAAGAVPAVATVAPPGKPGPGALRIRAASRDWFIEARSESHYEDFFGERRRLRAARRPSQTLQAGGVIVSRAERRYATNQTGSSRTRTGTRPPSVRPAIQPIRPSFEAPRRCSSRARPDGSRRVPARRPASGRRPARRRCRPPGWTRRRP